VDMDAKGKEKDDGGERKSENRIYGDMQRTLLKRLEAGLRKITSATRVMAAPLAIGEGDSVNIDFAKYSVVGDLLKLAVDHKGDFTLVTNCAVERIVDQCGVATALETSRGTLPLMFPEKEGAHPSKTASLILAVGCMPAATLLLNSFYEEEPHLSSVPNLMQDDPPEIKVPGDAGVPRNLPPPPARLARPGDKFSAHFISAIVGRIPRKPVEDPERPYGSFELGAIYLAGVQDDSELQWHAQISIVSDKHPQDNVNLALRYQPDVVAAASAAQLATSSDYIVFVFAVLGEMDVSNKDNFFKLLKKHQQEDRTANCLLQFKLNENDNKLWNTMDEASYEAFNVLAGDSEVDYWVGNDWKRGGKDITVFNEAKFRVPGMVHESCVVAWRADDEAESKSVVDENFRFKPCENVYLTGSGLWPTGASWNPTLTMVGFAQTLAEKLSQHPH